MQEPVNLNLFGILTKSGGGGVGEAPTPLPLPITTWPILIFWKKGIHIWQKDIFKLY